MQDTGYSLRILTILLRHLRPKIPGTNTIYIQTPSRPLTAKRLRDLQHPSLGRRVRRNVIPADETDDTPDIDDFASLVLRQDVFREFLARDEGCFEIDVEDVVDCVVVEGLGGTASLDPRAVQQDVCLMAVGEDLGECRAKCFAVRDVAFVFG